jgi:hypothetical protein
MAGDALTADTESFKRRCLDGMAAWNYATVAYLCDGLVAKAAASDDNRQAAIDVLTFLNDRHYATGDKKRAAVLDILRKALGRLFSAVPLIIGSWGASPGGPGRAAIA